MLSDRPLDESIGDAIFSSAINATKTQLVVTYQENLFCLPRTVHVDRHTLWQLCKDFRDLCETLFKKADAMEQCIVDLEKLNSSDNLSLEKITKDMGSLGLECSKALELTDFFYACALRSLAEKRTHFHRTLKPKIKAYLQDFHRAFGGYFSTASPSAYSKLCNPEHGIYHVFVLMLDITTLTDCFEREESNAFFSILEERDPAAAHFFRAKLEKSDPEQFLRFLKEKEGNQNAFFADLKIVFCTLQEYIQRLNTVNQKIEADLPQLHTLLKEPNPPVKEPSPLPSLESSPSIKKVNLSLLPLRGNPLRGNSLPKPQQPLVQQPQPVCQSPSRGGSRGVTPMERIPERPEKPEKLPLPVGGQKAKQCLPPPPTSPVKTSSPPLESPISPISSAFSFDRPFFTPLPGPVKPVGKNASGLFRDPKVFSDLKADAPPFTPGASRSTIPYRP